MRRLFTSLLLALTVLPTSVMADVGDIINDTVIALLRAGLSDAAIISVVDRPRTDFDVDPEALIRLREEGLSNAVIEAIIAAEKRTRPAETPSAAVPSAAVEPSVVSFELMFWDSIKHSASAADFEAYLQRYPNGAFVLLARNRLKNLMESPTETMAVMPSPIALDVTELIQNTVLKNAIRRLAESKYRIEIERFVSMTIKNSSSTGITIDLTYLWRRDDTSQRFGRGKATMQEVGWGYKVVDVESIVPTRIQLSRFGQDPGI